MNGLFGSAVLEVAIGLAMVYLLLAAFCAAANEWIAAALNTRADMLRQGISQLLHGDGFAAGFYQHPLIRALMNQGEHPAYLPARAFARTVMDLATPLQQGCITFEQLEQGIKALPEGGARASLLAVIQTADRKIDVAQGAIEGWYNEAMDRLSSGYKRRTQIWTTALAAAVTVATNADTIRLARGFWLEPVMRNGATLTLGPVLGWNGLNDGNTPAVWVTRVVGWLVTIMAVSLGAPFWFDVLNKMVNVRWGAKPPEKP